MKSPLLLFLAFTGFFPTNTRADAVGLTSAAVVVTERTATDGTTYYSIAVSPPRGLSSVAHAWLEFRADISARNLDGFVDPAPILEVYSLKQVLSGDPDPSEFDATVIPMSRPTAAGTDRLMRIDITEYLQKILAEPSKNHGIVLGPLTSDKRGIFDIREDTFGPGVVARVQIIE